MLKYVSEILTKFTPQQRVIALLLLLLSIVLMTNGSELIKSIKGTPEDVVSVLENQKNQIQILQSETSQLNNQIIDIQRECTNKILKREGEIAIEIGNIINILTKRERVLPVVILDTINTGYPVHAISSPPPIDNTNEIIYHLGRLKKSLESTHTPH